MIGFLAGVVVTGLGVYLLMPKLMIQTRESRFGYAQTVQKIEEAITSAQWGHKGTLHITDEIQAKTNKNLGAKIAVVKLCKADYAYQVLEQDKNRFVSCLMPCGISVWEAGDGKTRISKMNTGLMGKMFGGAIARVMGGSVAKDEKVILQGIIQE